MRATVPADLIDRVRGRVASVGLRVNEAEYNKLLAYVWPALLKMKRRDEKYRAVRESAFTTTAGRRYCRELSIDELPGLTTPETTAVMLSLCEALDMQINFVAPAFGFQKNTPYLDNSELRLLIERQWAVCRAFDASIGFHSGSGKSDENYQVMGQVTGGLPGSQDERTVHLRDGCRAVEIGATPATQRSGGDWYRFTLEMALAGAFSADGTERKMARDFITSALAPHQAADVFRSPAACRAALEALTPSPDYMFFFEYNFLYVLAAGGRADKSALGDHSPAGYAQRARFYAISADARLRYSKAVAGYIVFLAQPYRPRAARPLHGGYRAPGAIHVARKDARRYLTSHIDEDAKPSVRHTFHVEGHRLHVHLDSRIRHHFLVHPVPVAA